MFGRIPDGGGWRARGREATSIAKAKRLKVGYDYIHTAVDDHSRLAYSEILPDERGDTAAGFLATEPPSSSPTTGSNGSKR